MLEDPWKNRSRWLSQMTPARLATFFCGDLIMKYFLSLLLIQEGQLSVSGETQYWLTV